MITKAENRCDPNKRKEYIAKCAVGVVKTSICLTRQYIESSKKPSLTPQDYSKFILCFKDVVTECPKLIEDIKVCKERENIPTEISNRRFNNFRRPFMGDYEEELDGWKEFELELNSKFRIITCINCGNRIRVRSKPEDITFFSCPKCGYKISIPLLTVEGF